MVELSKKIEKLKRERNAVILAHSYQLDEVQKVADYVGDSFYLSKIAANIECEVIAFAGVRFMAETAAILSPAKVVLLPEIDAGCPLADMITGDDVRTLKRQHPGTPVVCYINSPAEVKAESDICCTSSNAIRVIASLPNHKVIFVPDENLGNYVARQLVDKELVLWKGCCVTHAKVKPTDILLMKEKYPEAKVLVHPECVPAVVDMADFVGGTSEILRYAETTDANILLIGTEVGVLSTLRSSCPGKQFFLLHPGLVCPNMKKIRLQSIFEALNHNQHQVFVENTVAAKARRSITRMLGVS